MTESWWDTAGDRAEIILIGVLSLIGLALLTLAIIYNDTFRGLLGLLMVVAADVRRLLREVRKP